MEGDRDAEHPLDQLHQGADEPRSRRRRLIRLAGLALGLALAGPLLPGVPLLGATAAGAVTCPDPKNTTEESGLSLGKDVTCDTATPGSPGRPGRPAISYPYLLQFCGTNKVNPALNDPAASYRILSTGPVQFRGESGIVGFYYYDARPGRGVTTADDPNYVQATVQCFDNAGAPLFTSVVVIPRNAVVIIDPLVLRDEARARITIGLPPIVTNPPWDQPNRFGVVRVPTWLWLDPGYWVAHSETAAQGPIVVTVTANPVTAAWSPGDGSADVVCAGPGVAWHAGLAESATDCSHTYTSSSADRAGSAYQLGVTVRWEFAWTLNGVDQGVFGAVDAAAAPVVYRVGEIQAVSAAGG